MAVRCFVMPVVDLELSPGHFGLVPKYYEDIKPFSGALYFGAENTLCIVVSDVSNATATTLGALSDCVLVPVNLLDQMTGQNATKLKDFLESVFIPAQWVNPSNSYREVLRVVIGCGLFFRRYSYEKKSRFFTGGITLATKFSDLAADVQAQLQAAAVELGVVLDAAPNDQLRKIMKTIGDTWANIPTTIGALTI